MKKSKVVTVGGGTGHFALLSGLRDKPFDITAIVTMADDGGSTGVLRDEMGVLPPGDVRRCLTALSKERDVMRALFDYRFDSDVKGLHGHSLGNLFLAALEKVTGNFPDAVREAGRVLNVRGRVMPVSTEKMSLHVELKDGTVLRGEHTLSNHEDVQKKGVKRVFIPETVRAYEGSLRAIRAADTIVLGPGGLHDSLLPNLLVPGISEAIQASDAVVVYVANVTNKKGQTEKFTIDMYVDALEEHIGKGRIDVVLGNDKEPSGKLLERYEEHEGEGAHVKCRSKSDTFTLVCENLLINGEVERDKNDKIAYSRSFIRHDPEKLAAVLERVVEGGVTKTLVS